MPTKNQSNLLTTSQPYQPTKSSTGKLIEIGIAKGIICDAGISDKENHLSLVFEHSSPLEMAWGLVRLHDSNLLNSENKKALEKHPLPNGIALVLRLLHSVELLTPENRLAIQEKKDPHSVAYVLFKLYYADLLTQKIFTRVLAHPCLETINNLFREFNRHNILTQTRFAKIMGPQQEENSLSYNQKKMLIWNLPIRCISAGFFSSQKHGHDKKSEIAQHEFNKQI